MNELLSEFSTDEDYSSLDITGKITLSISKNFFKFANITKTVSYIITNNLKNADFTIYIAEKQQPSPHSFFQITGLLSLLRFLLTVGQGNSAYVEAAIELTKNTDLGIQRTNGEKISLIELALAWDSLQSFTTLVKMGSDIDLASIFLEKIGAEKQKRYLEAFLKNSKKTAEKINQPTNYNRFRPLHLAILLGNLPLIKTCIAYGANSQLKSLGFSSLHWALVTYPEDEQKSLVFLEKLHKEIPSLFDNIKQHSSIFFPIAFNWPAVTKFLKDRGWDPNLPISYTKFNKILELLKNRHEGFRLIKSPSTSTAKIDSWGKRLGPTPLLTAAINGHLNMVQLLESYGVPLNSPDIYGGTPLHISSLAGQLNVVVYLLQQGETPRINDKTIFGATPLYMAVNHGHLEVVKTLIAYGADPHAADKLDSLLSLASYNNLPEITQYLLKGRNNLLEDNKEKDCFRVAAARGHLEVLSLLVNHQLQHEASQLTKIITILAFDALGVDEVAKTKISGTITSNKQAETFAYLWNLEMFSPEILNEEGYTLLQWAVKNHASAETIKLLIGEQDKEKGILSSKIITQQHKNTGDTALHIACKKINSEVIKLLTPLLDWKTKNKAGYTTLDILLISMNKTEDSSKKHFVILTDLIGKELPTEIDIRPDSHAALINLRKDKVWNFFLSKIKINIQQPSELSSSSSIESTPAISYIPLVPSIKRGKTLKGGHALAQEKLGIYAPSPAAPPLISWCNKAFTAQHFLIKEIDPENAPYCYLYIDNSSLIAQARKSGLAGIVTEEKLKSISGTLYHPLEGKYLINLKIKETLFKAKLTHEIKIDKKHRILVARLPKHCNDDQVCKRGTLFIGIILRDLHKHIDIKSLQKELETNIYEVNLPANIGVTETQSASASAAATPNPF